MAWAAVSQHGLNVGGGSEWQEWEAGWAQLGHKSVLIFTGLDCLSCRSLHRRYSSTLTPGCRLRMVCGASMDVDGWWWAAVVQRQNADGCMAREKGANCCYNEVASRTALDAA